MGRFNCTGAGPPPGSCGRPGAAVTPDFASGDAERGGCGARGCGITTGGAFVSTEWDGWDAPSDGVTAVVGPLLATICTRVVGVGFGGFASCGIGSNLSGVSVLPLCTKTFACGFATITRSGALGVPTCPEGVVAGSTPGFGITFVSGFDSSGGRSVAATGWVGGRGGKSGVVFDPGGAPVSGGALGGSWGIAPEGGRDKLGIGLVTAVDHAGGTVGIGVGSALPTIGRVVAAEMLGRAVIFVDAGFSGLGGRLIRSVSRCGAFGSSGGGGGAGSAMD